MCARWRRGFIQRGTFATRNLTHQLSVSYSHIILPLAQRRQTATAFAPHTSHSNLHSARAVPASRSTFATTTSLAAMPICIVVEAEIKEDRMDDFLDMIEKNAVGSRAEPGCIRFGAYFVVYCVAV